MGRGQRGARSSFGGLASKDGGDGGSGGAIVQTKSTVARVIVKAHGEALALAAGASVDVLVGTPGAGNIWFVVFKCLTIAGEAFVEQSFDVDPNNGGINAVIIGSDAGVQTCRIHNRYGGNCTLDWKVIEFGATDIAVVTNVTGSGGGGGGGGGAVNSVTAGAGLTDTGTATDPILNSKLWNLLTANGDTLSRIAGVPAKIAIGAANTVYKSNGTIPVWAVDAMTALLTANGDIITRIAGVPAVVPVGAHPDGSFMSLVGGLPDWVPGGGSLVASGTIVGSATTTLTLDGVSDYLLAYQWLAGAAGVDVRFRFNGSSSNQGNIFIRSGGGAVPTSGNSTYLSLGADGTANIQISGMAVISCKAGMCREFFSRETHGRAAVNFYDQLVLNGGGWKDDTTALISADIVVATGALVAPSRWYLYRRNTP